MELSSHELMTANERLQAQNARNLEVLDKLNVNATFFVCGTTAEKYPGAVKAAAKAGHEIAGMSYQFDASAPRIRIASAAW